MEDKEKKSYDPFGNDPINSIDFDISLDENKNLFSAYKHENIFSVDINNLKEKSFQKNEESLKNESVLPKRLNAFDIDILDNSSCLNSDDEKLSLKDRIENLDNVSDNIDEKIEFAKSNSNFELVQRLELEKEQVRLKIENLKKELASKNILNKFNFLNEESRQKLDMFVKSSQTVVEKIFEPLIPKSKIKATLSKLNKINKNVDELVKLQIPYGEEEERYKILASHLAKASHLHARISKELK